MKKTKKKPSAKKKTKRSSLASGVDLIQLILKDHVALKKLIEVMKSSKQSISNRRKAFKEFAPLLIRHAKPEEQVLYSFFKSDPDLKEEGFEGEVEHGLAEQLVDEAIRTEDEDLLGARLKVLAELVEHHIEEEEGELLPDYKRASSAQEREEMGQMFLREKENTLNDGNQKKVEEVDYEKNTWSADPH